MHGKISVRTPVVFLAGCVTKGMMATGKWENGLFWGHCELCGRWRPVIPEQVASEAFFTHWRAVFTCCGREQVALITVEKDELDFH